MYKLKFNAINTFITSWLGRNTWIRSLFLFEFMNRWIIWYSACFVNLKPLALKIVNLRSDLKLFKLAIFDVMNVVIHLCVNNCERSKQLTIKLTICVNYLKLTVHNYINYYETNYFFVGYSSKISSIKIMYVIQILFS